MSKNRFLKAIVLAVCALMILTAMEIDYQDEVAYQEYQCEMVNSGVWVDYEVKGCDEQK